MEIRGLAQNLFDTKLKNLRLWRRVIWRWHESSQTIAVEDRDTSGEVRCRKGRDALGNDINALTGWREREEAARHVRDFATADGWSNLGPPYPAFGGESVKNCIRNSNVDVQVATGILRSASDCTVQPHCPNAFIGVKKLSGTIEQGLIALRHWTKIDRVHTDSSRDPKETECEV
jgi:hypothetical protein